MLLESPAKSFLLGEYLVLTGGPAILFATPPCFTYETKTGIFADPFGGLGGFGASSARFVLEKIAQGLKDPWEIWESYRLSGMAGSGADVMVQCLGSTTFFHANAHKLEKLSWPFEDLSIALIHTGIKLVTHEHLAELELPSNSQMILFEEIVMNAYQAIKTNQANHIIQAINDYSEALLKLDLVASHTKILLEKLRLHPSVLACKGCGAMGSDVVLVVIPTEVKENFCDWVNNEKLNLVYCGNIFYESI